VSRDIGVPAKSGAVGAIVSGAVDAIVRGAVGAVVSKLLVML
jgi:hypothetical protein